MRDLLRLHGVWELNFGKIMAGRTPFIPSVDRHGVPRKKNRMSGIVFIVNAVASVSNRAFIS